MADAAPTREDIRFDTVEDYLDWALTQPGRYELVDGVVHAMSPERIGHALCKGQAYTALRNAVEKAGLPCTVIPDGVTVKAAENIAYEPDVTVQCAPLDGESIVADAPVILVEVISPSSRNIDTGKKLAGYFTIPTVQHYLILDTEKRLVIHHARKDDSIETRFVSEGSLALDPPGLAVAVEDVFAQSALPPKS